MIRDIPNVIIIIKNKLFGNSQSQNTEYNTGYELRLTAELRELVF
jgi:hypothetical protein